MKSIRYILFVLVLLGSNFLKTANKELAREDETNREKLKYAIDKNDISLLKDVLNKESKQLLSLFLPSKVWSNKKDEYLTPIIYAIKARAKLNIIKELLNAQQDLPLYPKISIEYLFNSKNDETFNYFLSEMKRSNDKWHLEPDNLLINAIRTDNPYVVAKSIAIGANLNHGMGGQYPLNFLANSNKKNSTNIAKILLNNNANPNNQDYKGDTALMQAVERGNLPLTEILLRTGADPNIKNNVGNTALDIAEKQNRGNSKAIVKLLKDWPKIKAEREQKVRTELMKHLPVYGSAGNPTEVTLGYLGGNIGR